MLKFVVRRLVQLVPILLGLSLLVFAWVRALPGGPETALLGERATPARVAEVRRAYGLDRPLYQQYGSYMGRVVRLDFGQSIATQRSVASEIRRRFPATIELTLAAMVFAIGLGLPLGFLAARRAGTALDQLSMGGSLLGISVPVFFLAFILKYVFAVKLGWLPTVGRLDVLRTVSHPTGFYVLDAVLTLDFPTLVDALRHLVLPGIALGTIPLAIVTRITRAAVLEVVNEDYVRTARAKGLTAGVVNRRHVLKNAMLPITTVIGLQTGLLLSGAVLTEIVFAWGGMGSFLYQAVFDRDFPVLQGGILFLAVVFVLVNLLVDISYGLLDPRIRVR
ncbi:MAG: peptide/nickel transport system permease protein [Actinomycetota bacterium]|jgi:peptide/nickel transport system permease protein|nr:peptide/nickel transport system permease protein [Actinomycetota bacterium]